MTTQTTKKIPSDPTDEILLALAKKMRVRMDTPNTTAWYKAVVITLREQGYVR